METVLPFETNTLCNSDSCGITWKVDSSFTPDKTLFWGPYNRIPGVLTFRGNNLRDGSSIGEIPNGADSIYTEWTAELMEATESWQAHWGNGVGWTGQPVVVQWPDSLRKTFQQLYPEFRDKAGFREVIQGSLSGKIFFFDFETGKPSRPYLKIGGPIKGSVSVHPGGLPLLFVGQGIGGGGEFGFHIFDLTNQQRLHYQDGRDAFGKKGWGAFDGAPLVDLEHDALWWAGENGLLYRMRLNYYDGQLHPIINKLKFKVPGHWKGGSESSISICKNLLYLTDNGGSVVCFDLQKLAPVWVFDNSDDTDASPVVEVENEIPYVYVGNEVDIQGDRGTAYVRKLNGLTGELVWEKGFDCTSVHGDRPVNGGMLSTVLCGKNAGKEVVVASMSRFESARGGGLIALNKEDGTVKWQVKLDAFAWSSPIALYSQNGSWAVFIVDAVGMAYLVDGETGKLLHKYATGHLFEATPVAWDDRIVVASRNHQLFCFKIR